MLLAPRSNNVLLGYQDGAKAHNSTPVPKITPGAVAHSRDPRSFSKHRQKLFSTILPDTVILSHLSHVVNTFEDLTKRMQNSYGANLKTAGRNVE